MTRSSSSSPDAFGALNIAAEAYHSKSYFFSDRFSIDGYTSVRFLVCSFYVAFVTGLQFCKRY